MKELKELKDKYVLDTTVTKIYIKDLYTMIQYENLSR